MATWMSPSSRRAWIEMIQHKLQVHKTGVALLAEGVDRNVYELNHSQSVYQSPSSRRAWIEMLMRLDRPCAFAVALLAEGVDRNSAS